MTFDIAYILNRSALIVATSALPVILFCFTQRDRRLVLEISALILFSCLAVSGLMLLDGSRLWLAGVPYKPFRVGPSFLSFRTMILPVIAWTVWVPATFYGVIVLVMDRIMPFRAHRSGLCAVAGATAALSLLWLVLILRYGQLIFDAAIWKPVAVCASAALLIWRKMPLRRIGSRTTRYAAIAATLLSLLWTVFFCRYGAFLHEDTVWAEGFSASKWKKIEVAAPRQSILDLMGAPLPSPGRGLEEGGIVPELWGMNYSSGYRAAIWFEEGRVKKKFLWFDD